MHACLDIPGVGLSHCKPIWLYLLEQNTYITPPPSEVPQMYGSAHTQTPGGTSKKGNSSDVGRSEISHRCMWQSRTARGDLHSPPEAGRTEQVRDLLAPMSHPTCPRDVHPSSPVVGRTCQWCPNLSAMSSCQRRWLISSWLDPHGTCQNPFTQSSQVWAGSCGEETLYLHARLPGGIWLSLVGSRALLTAAYPCWVGHGHRGHTFRLCEILSQVLRVSSPVGGHNMGRVYSADSHFPRGKCLLGNVDVCTHFDSHICSVVH